MTAQVIPFARATEPSLDPLMALVAEGLNSVNAVILDRMQSRIPLIPALAASQALARTKQPRSWSAANRS